MSKLYIVETKSAFKHLYAIEAETPSEALVKVHDDLIMGDLTELGQTFIGEECIQAYESGLDDIKDLYKEYNKTTVLLDSYLKILINK